MATAGMAVMVPALAGVALAAVITCTGGRCEGTNEPDQITGTDQRDRIFALDGSDEVEARAGEDDLNGGNGGDRLRVEHYSKQNAKQWIFRIYNDREDVLTLDSVGCKVSLAEIYAQIKFGQTE